MIFRLNPALMALGAIEDQTFLDVNDAWLATTGYLIPSAVIRS
jgi:hypothetical protein